MGDSRRTVELKTAFHWHCDECSQENFALPQKVELTDEDADRAYRWHHGLDDWCDLPEGWRQFEIVSIPDKVRCSNCDEVFLTMDESSA